MTKEIIIITLIIVLIYFYYQKKKKFIGEMTQLDQTLMSLLNVGSLEELKTKLGEKNLDELLEENQDYETEVDTLTRTKNSLEADLLAQSNAFQNRLREKDREVKKLKEDLTNEKKRADNTQQSLTSEKQQHKGSLGRITKLTEQITNLEQQVQRTKSPLPGEFPPEDLTQEHQEQLRKINCLFDPNAADYQEIDFNGLYTLLETIAQEQKKRKDWLASFNKD